MRATLLAVIVGLLAAAGLHAGAAAARAPVAVDIPSGDVVMKGRVFPSGRSTAPTVLLVPGWPGNPNDVLGLGALLSRRGLTAVTFNPRGMHSSGGTFSFANALEDIRSALEWVRRPEVSRKFGVDPARVVLAGHSWGGGMSLAYAARDPSVRRIVSIAGNDHAEFIRQYRQNPQMAAAVDKMLASARAPGGPVRFDPQAGLSELADHMDVYGLIENASRLADRDILIVGGWEDDQVTVDRYLLPFYRALKRAGAVNVRFLVYHDAHDFVLVRERLAGDIRDWVLRVR